MKFSEEQLILDYLGGRDAAFEELAQIYLGPIYNFIFRLVGNAGEAEDIAQEVFFRVWKNLRQYKMGASFRAWIFGIARNAVIDKLRKKKDLAFSDLNNKDEENSFIDTLVDEGLLPSEEIEKVLQNEALVELLGQLSFVCREVILLHYNQGFSFEEIGNILHASINTVKSRHHRALLTLRKLIKNAPKLDAGSY